MVYFKYIVIIAVAAVASCRSRQITTEINSNPDSSFEKTIFDILTRQDEKLNRLHTLVLTNELLPRCTLAIISGNMNSASKYWKELTSEIKIYDHSAATELKLLCHLITDAYNGEQSRSLTIVQFVKNNVERGSELAYSAYDALLNEMDGYGKLFFREIKEDNGLGSGLNENLYRVLYAIKEAEGDSSSISSSIFTKKLPSVVNTILMGEKIFIQNSVTKNFLYASPNDSTDVLLGDRSGTDSRYIWKLSPVFSEWTRNNRELFHITNTFEDKYLAIGGQSLVLVDSADEKVQNTWAMFYVQLVEGSSGEEVAIQISYWGIKTLALDGDGVTKNLVTLESLEKTPSAIWLLQPAK